MKRDNNKKKNLLGRIFTAALALILGASGVEGIKKNLYLPNTNGNTPIEQNDKQGGEVGEKTAKTPDKTPDKTTREKTGEKSSKIKEGEKDSSGKASVPSNNKKTTGGKAEDKQPTAQSKNGEEDNTDGAQEKTKASGSNLDTNSADETPKENETINLNSINAFGKNELGDGIYETFPGYYSAHIWDTGYDILKQLKPGTTVNITNENGETTRIAINNVVIGPDYDNYSDMFGEMNFGDKAVVQVCEWKQIAFETEPNKYIQVEAHHEQLFGKTGNNVYVIGEFLDKNKRNEVNHSRVLYFDYVSEDYGFDWKRMTDLASQILRGEISPGTYYGLEMEDGYKEMYKFYPTGDGSIQCEYCISKDGINVDERIHTVPFFEEPDYSEPTTEELQNSNYEETTYETVSQSQEPTIDDPAYNYNPEPEPAPEPASQPEDLGSTELQQDTEVEYYSAQSADSNHHSTNQSNEDREL